MISAEIKNVSLNFETDPSNFSPNSIDVGTLAMLSAVDFLPSDKVLDMGCGYGVVGILAAKLIGQENVAMCDISEAAVKQAKINAEMNGVPNIKIKISDGFSEIPDNDFTLILSNPPYHTDFSVPKHFIEVGFKKLAVGGKMIMVTKRLDWYKNKLTSVFGGVMVREINGYYVFISEKRGERVRKKEKTVNKLSKKLRKKRRGV
ncbi:MAG: methyltransferase [Ruminococcus sp.]|nr:methyltransferase [Ruminococcus sp.]